MRVICMIIYFVWFLCWDKIRVLEFDFFRHVVYPTVLLGDKIGAGYYVVLDRCCFVR